MIEQVLGMPLDKAHKMLEQMQVTSVEEREYIAPNRKRQGDDLRVVQAWLKNGCATLVYSAFKTNILDEDERFTHGDNQ